MPRLLVIFNYSNVAFFYTILYSKLVFESGSMTFFLRFSSSPTEITTRHFITFFISLISCKLFYSLFQVKFCKI